MAARRGPWFRIQSRAWLSSPRVRRLSCAARGVLVDVCAFTWENGGEHPCLTDAVVLARQLGADPEEVAAALDELARDGYVEEFLALFWAKQEATSSAQRTRAWRARRADVTSQRRHGDVTRRLSDALDGDGDGDGEEEEHSPPRARARGAGPSRDDLPHPTNGAAPTTATVVVERPEPAWRRAVRLDPDAYAGRMRLALERRAAEPGSELDRWTQELTDALYRWLRAAIPCKPEFLGSLARELDEALGRYGAANLLRCLEAHGRGGWQNWTPDWLRKNCKKR